MVNQTVVKTHDSFIHLNKHYLETFYKKILISSKFNEAIQQYDQRYYTLTDYVLYHKSSFACNTN